MKFTLSAGASAVFAAALLAGCVVQAPPPRVVVAAPVAYVPPPPPPVVSVYIEPPLAQPAPIAVGWAPPPMLVEPPPPSPIVGAVWIGGYWTWQGDWIWAAGRWAPPPRPEYVWVQPYYEHRDAAVLFIGGHWRSPDVEFVPPPPGLRFTAALALPGIVPGPPPMGPPGIFVPPPPGSRPGIIVPAPLGTPPALMVGAPPVRALGMRVQNNVNVTQVTHITQINNVTNLTVVAPAEATQNGRAFEASLPAQPHLAAAMTPVVLHAAPVPQSAVPVPAYRVGQAPASLPPPQAVRLTAAAPRPVPGGPPPRPAPIETSVPGNSGPAALSSAPTVPPPAAATFPPPPVRPESPGTEGGRMRAERAPAQAPSAGVAEAARPVPAPPTAVPAPPVPGRARPTAAAPPPGRPASAAPPPRAAAKPAHPPQRPAAEKKPHEPGDPDKR